MEKGQNMKEHINHIKTLLEHLEAIDNRIAVYLVFLSEEYNYLITALETIAEDHLTWDYARDMFFFINMTFISMYRLRFGDFLSIR